MRPWLRWCVRPARPRAPNAPSQAPQPPSCACASDCHLTTMLLTPITEILRDTVPLDRIVSDNVSPRTALDFDIIDRSNRQLTQLACHRELSLAFWSGMS